MFPNIGLHYSTKIIMDKRATEETRQSGLVSWFRSRRVCCHQDANRTRERVPVRRRSGARFGVLLPSVRQSGAWGCFTLVGIATGCLCRHFDTLTTFGKCASKYWPTNSYSAFSCVAPSRKRLMAPACNAGASGYSWAIALRAVRSFFYCSAEGNAPIRSSQLSFSAKLASDAMGSCASSRTAGKTFWPMVSCNLVKR